MKGENAAKMIIDHLKQPAASHSLEVLCDEIAQVQRLAKSSGSNNSSSKGQEEVNLTSTDGKGGGKKGGSDKKSEGGKTDKTCNHCGKKGHLEKSCWHKNPDKAPKWVKEKEAKKGKKKSESLAADIMLCNLELGGTDDRELMSATIDHKFSLNCCTVQIFGFVIQEHLVIPRTMTLV